MNIKMVTEVLVHDGDSLLLDVSSGNIGVGLEGLLFKCIPRVKLRSCVTIY